MKNTIPRGFVGTFAAVLWAEKEGEPSVHAAFVFEDQAERDAELLRARGWVATVSLLTEGESGTLGK